MSNNRDNLFKAEIKDAHTLSYYRFLHTSSWIETQVKAALKPLGLTHSQLNVLYLLVQNDPEPLSASAIKENLIVDKPDLTRLIDRLVKKGYVDRGTCPENRRKIDISVTEKGKDVFYNAHSAAKRAVNNFFKDVISEEEAGQLYSILKKINK